MGDSGIRDIFDVVWNWKGLNKKYKTPVKKRMAVAWIFAETKVSAAAPPWLLRVRRQKMKRAIPISHKWLLFRNKGERIYLILIVLFYLFKK